MRCKMRSTRKRKSRERGIKRRQTGSRVLLNAVKLKTSSQGRDVGGAQKNLWARTLFVNLVMLRKTETYEQNADSMWSVVRLAWTDARLPACFCWRGHFTDCLPSRTKSPFSGGELSPLRHTVACESTAGTRSAHLFSGSYTIIFLMLSLSLCDFPCDWLVWCIRRLLLTMKPPTD